MAPEILFRILCIRSGVGETLGNVGCWRDVDNTGDTLSIFL